MPTRSVTPTAVTSYWTSGVSSVLSAIDDSGYFNPVADQLRKGDLILVSSATGGTPVFGALIVTSATAAATVTTAVFPIGS